MIFDFSPKLWMESLQQNFHRSEFGTSLLVASVPRSVPHFQVANVANQPKSQDQNLHPLKIWSKIHLFFHFLRGAKATSFIQFLFREEGLRSGLSFAVFFSSTHKKAHPTELPGSLAVILRVVTPFSPHFHLVFPSAPWLPHIPQDYSSSPYDSRTFWMSLAITPVFQQQSWRELVVAISSRVGGN